MPERIQLSRRKGWRKPADAVVVARPSRWGNPFVIGHEHTRDETVRLFRQALLAGELDRISVADVRTQLRGRDLACWCPLDQACHADVLIEIANGAPDGPLLT